MFGGYLIISFLILFGIAINSHSLEIPSVRTVGIYHRYSHVAFPSFLKADDSPRVVFQNLHQFKYKGHFDILFILDRSSKYFVS